MKTIVSLAVLALISGAKAEDVKKSLVERAQEDDDISAGSSKWNDVGYFQSGADIKAADENLLNVDADTSIQTMNKEKIIIQERETKGEELKNQINEKEGSESNKKLFASIQEKLSDQSFIQQAIQATTTPGASHTGDLANEHNSADLSPGDFGDRDTDRMGNYAVGGEDNFHQGHDGLSGGESADKNQPKHLLPNSWDKMGPTNQPHHFTKGEYAKAGSFDASTSGLVLAYLTVDNDEHATRFVKELFNQGLIAAANQYEGHFQRTYLKFGRMTTESGRDRLELTTTNDKVNALIDFVNDNNPTSYDYPVPDIYVLPVSNGNEDYVKWVKDHLGHEAGVHQEPTDHGHDEEEGHGDEHEEHLV